MGDILLDKMVDIILYDEPSRRVVVPGHGVVAVVMVVGERLWVVAVVAVVVPVVAVAVLEGVLVVEVVVPCLVLQLLILYNIHLRMMEDIFVCREDDRMSQVTSE